MHQKNDPELASILESLQQLLATMPCHPGEPDELDRAAEILDALANKLARDRPSDQTLKLIAQRARKFYRQRMGDNGSVIKA